MRTPILFSLASVFALACASTPGAQPHDMSATGHDRMADNEQQTANAHGARVDPSAPPAGPRCMSTMATGSGDACWTDDDDANADHREDAERHRKMAADHRAASQTLRDAEARACVGVSDHDRDVSPFRHRKDVVRVEPLSEGIGSARTPPGRDAASRIVGAIVVFRAVPGLTAEKLQRIVDCHVARSAALGHVVPEMLYCPLVPNGVTAKVTAASDGFAVAIRADDPANADEILRRARALERR